MVIIENVYGVATLQGGSALRNLEASAIELGYSRSFSKKVTFAMYGDPENRTRIVIVAFHDSVAEEAIAQWPGQTKEVQLGHCTMMVASALAK